jgi:antitoxin ParD1/3/4
MIKYRMTAIERLTITLPTEMAALVKAAVSDGAYASSSEVIREALRDWELKTELRRHKLEALRRDIDEGLRDVQAGRLVTPDIDDIMARGRQQASRDPSA